MQTGNSGLWLIVENDEEDSLLLLRALRRLSPQPGLYLAKDGTVANLYLLGTGPFKNRRDYPLPSLILSDLNTPGLTGLELLAWIKQQPTLSQIPFVLLTHSMEPEDHGQAQALGADQFVVKPTQFDDLVHLMKSLAEQFWPHSW